MSTKHNVWDRKILKEFYYEFNRDRIVRVICPLFKKKKKKEKKKKKKKLHLTLFTLYHLHI